jgi:hypothetical protein
MRYRFFWATLAAVAVIVAGGFITHWGHGTAQASHHEPAAAQAPTSTDD